MIRQYLKYGSVFEVEYDEPEKYIDISEREAIEEYFKVLKLPEGYNLASSGGIDSSIIWCLNPYKAFCVSSTGNDDIHYATLLNPDIEDIRFDVDLEEELVLTANLWEAPHCGKTDPYDHFVYRQYENVITGEELYHLDTFRILKMGGSYIDRFTNTVEVFADNEMREFGYEPYRIKLKRDSLFHLESFLYDCWTKVSRKIFYKFDRVISPFLTEDFMNFYRSLPLAFKTHKKLQRMIAEKVIPKEIHERQKTYYIDGPNKKFLDEYKIQYNKLINKYLKDRSMRIFSMLDYDIVQKHLNNYRKMWALLNLSIWLQIN